MKTFFILIGFGIALIISTLLDETNIYTGTKKQQSIVVTFDGYEGGHYFFTDENGRAVSLSIDDELPANIEALKNGEHIGDQFEIDYLIEKDEDFMSLISEKELLDLELK